MSSGLRPLREGDQGYPIENKLPSMHDKARADLASRKAVGVQRYGVALQPSNGRDAIRDWYEEVLDAAAYGAQVVWEQDNPEHTYVGRLVRLLVEHGVAECHVARELFVPDSVVEYARARGLEFVRR